MRPLRFPPGIRLIMALALLLAGCNGEPDDPNARVVVVTLDPQSTQTLSGTVAAGAPLIGTLEVKDARGARKRVQVAADGSYHLGLKSLTFPLLLRATGYVGGHQVTLVSAATASDADGTVNVTPFTDLILAKLAHGAADAFFDAPDYTLLTNTQLDEARAMVTQVIASVMTELQVDPQLDLRRSPFVADHTRLDAMLDVVRVRVDASLNRAWVQDVVNGTATEIDLSNLNERVALPSPPHGSYAQAVTDLQAVGQALQQLNQLFASSIPSADNRTLRALFTDDFRHAGVDLITFLSSGQLLSASNVGLRLFNPVILSRATDGSSLRVSVQVLDTQGHAIAYDQVDSDELLMRKGSDGAWRIAGDRRMGDVALSAVNAIQLDSLSTATSPGVLRAIQALEWWVPSVAASVQYVQITGPGLPTATTISGLGQVAGVLLSRSNPTQAFTLVAASGQPNGSAWLLACPQASGTPCADMSRIPAWSSYTVRFLNAQFQAVGEDTSLALPAPPLPPQTAIAQATTRFARPTALSPASYTQLSDGSALRLSWAAPTAWDHTVSKVALADDSHQYSSAATDGGTAQSLGVWTGSAPTVAPLTWTRVQGPFDRAFVATLAYPQSSQEAP